MDIIEKWKNGKYEAKHTKLFHKKCKCGYYMSLTDIFCSSCGITLEIQREKITKKNKKIHNANRKAEATAQRLFRKDAFAHIGISQDHPKADKLFDIAWEKGHSTGYYEVVQWLEELSELLT